MDDSHHNNRTGDVHVDGRNEGNRSVWRRLPVLLIALLGLALGAYTGLRHGGGKDATTIAADAGADLAALQEKLVNAQVFPADFRAIDAFSLTDAHGQMIDQSVLDGQWSVMFFGYTYCPDVCPISLHVMKQVVDQLTTAGRAAPQVVFVSVDPKRDTPARLREYLAFFDPDFVGITGDQVKIHEFTRALGIVAAFTANEDNPENYVVDHTASMLVVDPLRRVRGKLNAPHAVESIVNDFSLMHDTLQLDLSTGTDA